MASDEDKGVKRLIMPLYGNDTQIEIGNRLFRHLKDKEDPYK